MKQKRRCFSWILIKYFLLLFICLILPVFFLGDYYMRKTKENLYEELIMHNERILEQVYENVDAVISSAKNMAYGLTINDSVQFLTHRDSIEDDNTGNLESLIGIISTINDFGDYLDSVYIYFDNSKEIVSDLGCSHWSELEDRDVLDYFSSDMPKTTFMINRKKNNHYPYLISIICAIRSSNKEVTGMVVVNIDSRKLGDFLGRGYYDGFKENSCLLIFDGVTDTLIYSDEYKFMHDPQLISVIKNRMKDFDEMYSGIYGLWDQNYIISTKDIVGENLKAAYMTTTNEFDQKNQITETAYGNGMIAMVAVALIVAYFLAKWVYRPIKSTINTLSDMSMLVDWDESVYADEIEVIQKSILSSKAEKDYLNIQMQERIKCLHNAQMCALQSQINPHFMYNTLTAIANSAGLLLGKGNVVTKMIISLAKLLRTSLSGKNYLVPVSEELEHVRLYIELVQFRYHGRVQLFMEIPEDMWDEQIVKLSLQPLIENAIQHGLVDVKNGGYIWLRGEKRGEERYIYVIDNGKGLEQEKLNEIQTRLSDSSITKESHIGLGNVNQRLKLIYGEEYGLRMERAKEGGLCVVVCFKKI